jgi:predicted dehydrogenase
MRRFEVGVLGVGYWGRKIVEEYSAIQNVKVRAVSDLMEKNRAHAKERYGVELAFDDYREVLKQESISAVHICLPNALHYPACKEALLAGKHVLVEKPITVSLQEGEELVRLAEEKNLTLSVGHIYRFNNALNEVKRLAADNFFGRLFLINMNWTNLEPVWTDRDVLLDLAPHYFDILNFITGAWPKQVTCVAKPFRQKSVEEAAYILCQMPTGAVSQAHLSWVSPKKVRQIEIVGENRSAVIDAVGQEVTVYESGYTYRLHVERNNTIRTELLHFLQSIGDPSTETRNSGSIGVKTVAAIEAAKRSLAEGRAIEMA